MDRVSKIVFLVLFFLALVSGRSWSEERLMVFCGAAFKRPIDEIIDVFQKKNMAQIYVTYGAVSTIFAQIQLTKRGDVFISPSEDFMEKGKKKGLIVGDSVKNIAYVVPCINVQKRNTKNIRGLKDLTRSGIRVAMGNPEIVYIGMLTAEVVDKSLSAQERDAFKRNVVTHTEDFNKLATLLVLAQVDAIIGFHFLEGWYPEKIGTVRLTADELQRIGAGQAGIISYSQSQELAQRFLDYLNSEEAKAVFKKYHYFTSPIEAFSWIGAKKPIGGEYAVPVDWYSR
ncbi:MAG: molybdate ABC transporter substrate-binding protein [Deltaproteobacteria bacterium RBG_13_52_11]|nr:MAG: molybdate ABC transporter substrate-binding protein [Deltaproteobacteria bacterium RBG_13_52_11]